MKGTMSVDDSVAQELPELLEILQEMKEKTECVAQHVKSLTEHAESNEYNPEKGVSFLEMKSQQMLSYVINLTQLMLTKAQGDTIRDCPALHRLVEIRTVLEKTRPLDQRLRYQVDKLMRVAAVGATGVQNDPLRFRPNPTQLVSKLESEEEEASSEDDRRSKAYVPPRVVAMPYEEEDGGRRERREAKLRQKALQSSVARDLQEELLDIPMEIQDVGLRGRKRKEVTEQQERERYEEEYFIRLPHKSRESRRAVLAEELTDFSALSGLTSRDTGATPSKKRRTHKTTRKQKERKGRH